MSDVFLPLIPTVLASAGAIAGLIKDIKNPQLQREVANLNKQLAVAEAHEADLIREITSLKAILLEEKENPLTFTGSVYYDTHNHPHCPGCYDGSGRTKKVHLETIVLQDGFKEFSCPVCDHTFEEGKRPVTAPRKWNVLDQF
jgi:hypothetical protein